MGGTVKLEQITLHTVEMELVSPFETSFGREVHRPAIIVEAHAQGLTGWGECVAGSGPWYSYETVQTAQHVLKDYLIPLLLKADVDHPRKLPQTFQRVRGHAMAKAGLEAACWDLWAQSQNISLSKALGGVKLQIESGVSVGVQKDLPALLSTIEGYRKAGYRRVKIKIKPGWDLDIVKGVRKAMPDLSLQVDANSAYTLEDAALFKSMDELGLLMIEQPLGYEDLADHAQLQAMLKTPICLDESVHTLDAVKAMLALDSGRIVNIKAGRVGGLTNAVAIHDLCSFRKIPVWCGGMLETGIGRAANVALASLAGFTLANDLSASDRYYRQDLIEPPFVLNQNGTLTVPTGSGLGVQINRKVLKAVTRQVETFLQPKPTR